MSSKAEGRQGTALSPQSKQKLGVGDGIGSSVSTPDDDRMQDLNKVAKVTLAFWIMKICATTLGETGSDLLSMTLNVGYGVSTLILLSLFGIALTAQLRATSFHPVLYWAVILATSTAGTTISDFMDRSLGLGYAAGAAILATTLAAVLAIWRIAIGSIATDTIKTFKVEMFYWIAIFVSNTLGTALGDFLADSSGLGFAGSALLISAMLALIAIAAFVTPLSKVWLFWMAFVLTRPLGATAGDFLTKKHDAGGLDFGTIGASAILAAILVIGLIVTMRISSRPEGGRSAA